MKSIIRFILAFLIFNLTFVKEDAAALESGDKATPLFVQFFSVVTEETRPRGLTFSNDGTKMFVVGGQADNSSTSGNADDDLHEYTLSTAFDISTASYVDSLAISVGDPMCVKFNNDGSKMFVSETTNDRVHEYLLTANFDLSSATYESFFSVQDDDSTLFAFDFNNDGTMMYVAGGQNDTIYQYKLDVGFDLSEGVNLLRTKNVSAQDGEPFGIEFNTNGTRMFIIGTSGNDVHRYDLSTGFNISTLSHVGFLRLDDEEENPSGIAFSTSGLKMFIIGDRGDKVNEYHLSCPFTLFSGNCPSITKNKDRTGIAEAQIMIAKRTIYHSTKRAFHRLEWIRRNKDNQNLTNLNNFNTAIKSDNPLLNSWMDKLLEKITARQASAKKKTKDKSLIEIINKKQDLFFWSEGSIAVGRVGDTSVSSTKKIGTEAITFGVDKFTNNDEIKGFAFRIGNNNVDVGTAGSNLDADTYNITYYSTSPMKDDTKYVDKIFGIGKIRTDILTVLDGKNLTADRTGNQIYGTVKIKDEYKKDNFTLIPSGQFDFGHTILNGYQEAGTGTIIVEDQHISTTKLRTAMAMVEDLSNDKYTFKRHGKLEYVADINRSSNFKYRYVSDRSTSFDDTLHTGALHNLNGEIGFDIIFPEHYSIFVIYERNHAFGSGYTDNIQIALGYLPYKDTKYAFSVDGSDNLMSQFEIKKNIKGYDFSFNLKNDLTNLGNDQEASINLNKVF